MHELVHDEQPAAAQQLVAVAQRVAHEGRRVQHVRRNNDVELPGSEALSPGIGVNIEQRVFNEAVLGESPPRLAQEHLRSHSRAGWSV